MRHRSLLTYLFCLNAGMALAQDSGQAQSEWDYLRAAAKEVELYLPNEVIVNQDGENTLQDGEIIDEISTGQAGLLRKKAPDTPRMRSLEAKPTPVSENSRSPAIPYKRVRSR